MSDKTMHDMHTQLTESHTLTCRLLPAGVAAPTIGEGDPRNFYFTPARTDVGVYTLQTNEPYTGYVTGHAQPHLGTPAGVFTDVASVQQSDNTWITTIACFDHTGAALELDNGNGDDISVTLTFRNTVQSP